MVDSERRHDDAGRLPAGIGEITTVDDAVAAFDPTERNSELTIIRVRP